MEFEIRFGKARISKMNEGHVNDPQNKWVIFYVIFEGSRLFVKLFMISK